MSRVRTVGLSLTALVLVVGIHGSATSPLPVTTAAERVDGSADRVTAAGTDGADQDLPPVSLAAADPVATRGTVPLSVGGTGSLLDIPSAAIAAYQRAEAVINEVSDCQLDWLVLAAIAGVESDHGRGLDGAHRISTHGTVRPAMTGTPLDGRAGRGTVHDTDRGQYDADVRWDRPVGPLGLLPETWSRVGVDADDDGRRDPQDLDDAALGAAVLLCAGGQHLRGPALHAALADYHPAPGYPRAVLALRDRYDAERAASLTSVPTGAALPVTVALGTDVPVPTDLPDLPDLCACVPRLRLVVADRLRTVPQLRVSDPDGRMRDPSAESESESEGSAEEPTEVAAPDPASEPEPDDQPQPTSTPDSGATARPDEPETAPADVPQSCDGTDGPAATDDPTTPDPCVAGEEPTNQEAP